MALLALVVALTAPCTARPAAPAGWLELREPGLRLLYTPEDQALARRLWPGMAADREAVMERLRMFPQQEVRVYLAPSEEQFDALLGGIPPENTLGMYLLGRRTIVLRSPRTIPGGGGNLRQVLRHELAHAVIDLAIDQPVPLWMHEGLAILVSDELDYLDETELTAAAVFGRLIPLPQLFDRFPVTAGARTVAYAEAASFVRFLLRQDGMAGLQRLLGRLAQGAQPAEAFQLTYSQSLDALEQRWQGELSSRFSTVTLITTTTLLGGLGLPLLLLAVARRAWQRRRAYRQWELEERLRASVRGEPAPDGEASPKEPERPPIGNGGANGSSPVRGGWS